MLDLQQVDLSALAEALEDHTFEHQWWLDPRSGEVELHLEELESDELGDPEERGLVFIEPTASSDAYADMADFSERAVLLFGSWARGDAHPESDIDLLVVLDQVHTRRAERKRRASCCGATRSRTTRW